MTQIFSYIVSTMALISAVLYGMGKNYKWYRWSGAFGMLTAALWAVYAVMLGKDGDGVLWLNVILFIVHFVNALKQRKEAVED